MDSLTSFFASGIISTIEASAWTLPFLLCAIMARAFFIIWVRYVQQLFLSKTEMVLVEARLPQEIFKSPKAMEILLGVFYQTGPGDMFGAYYEGKTRMVTSLEIVSREGKIHFYIWMRKGMKNLVEAQIYAQYPEVELHEVPDYTREMPYGLEGTSYNLWGCEYTLTKPDAYPIKTYIEYGLDQDKKPEFVVDPLASMLEFLGTIGQGEHIWFQIIIMAAEAYPKRPGAELKKSIKDQAKELVEDLSKRKLAKERAKEGKPLMPAEGQTTAGEKVVLEAVERNAAKNQFDVGMRAIYISRKEKFNPGNIPGLAGLLRPYSANDLNGFKPKNPTAFELPWQDPLGVRVEKKRQKLFEEYCKRAYFFYPVIKVPFVLSAEELATVYHFPSSAVKTPTLGRIESKRGEAPVNLPI